MSLGTTFILVCKFYLYRTKKFTRWMNGSCLEAKPVQVPTADEPVTFSYFSDVSAHVNILEQAMVVQETIKSGIAALVKQANYWKKYRALWKMQRVSAYK